MRARGEFEWIARLGGILESAGASGPAVAGRTPRGDDAAVIEDGAGGAWAWTMDTLVEGVHFRFDWLAPEDVGHRALAASLSDLAATGAAPVGALVSAAGPAATLAARLEGIYRGLATLAARAGCPIVGGDLARADGPLHLTVTALGRVSAGPPLGRAGARTGDEVWVSGRLGGPAAAIALIHAAARAGRDPRLAADRPSGQRFARPAPRGPEVAWLRERAPIAAAIDLSDGLSGDAAHVARASGVRIVLDPAALPILPDAAAAARELGADPVAWALHGGEEFELLLIARPATLGPLAPGFEAEFGIPLTRIGEVGPGAGVHLFADGVERPLASRSWDHFAQEPPERLAPPDGQG